jgi:hypothetical protein
MGMPDGVWAMSSIDDYRTFLQSAVRVRSTEVAIELTISYRAAPGPVTAKGASGAEAQKVRESPEGIRPGLR